MDCISGTWIAEPKAEKVDEFLKAAGVPDGMIETIKKREYEVTYSVDGNNVTCVAKVTNDPSVQPKTYTLTMGQESEVETLEGMMMKYTMTWDGSKYVEKCITGNMTIDSIREVNGSTMTVTSTMNGVSMKQNYTKA
ncbi:fatty acid-binding protein, liver [Aplysia californica]|uniref:Fatty acid-binding protein, liver n=1 Tax=Aplysia californica TaxID=6500 RepID=A0ABM1AAW8_APLCA|nr:fatty acid-binding protein, liver [Aplysia californica]